MVQRKFYLSRATSHRLKSHPPQPFMPSVAEQAPLPNFQENVGNDGVRRSTVRVLSLKLTAESRSLIGSISGTMDPRWTTIIPSSSLLD